MQHFFMDTEQEQKHLSKFLSYVLRHHPESIGLNLDQQGWAEVDLLLLKSREKGKTLTREILEQVVANNNKQRFSFSEDKMRIRASQGHSVPVELGYTELEPPEILYHGTTEKVVASILSEGLQRRNRHHVHLSTDRETALQVGGRRGKPHIFKVEAGKMYRNSFVFFKSENGVWLTKEVPPQYIK